MLNVNGNITQLKHVIKEDCSQSLENTDKEVSLQCVFHSIRFKVNKKIGCLGEIAFLWRKDFNAYICHYTKFHLMEFG